MFNYKKIIYLISLLDINDGASSAVISRVRREFEVRPHIEQIVVYKWRGNLPQDICCIHIDDVNSIKNKLDSFTIIHYHKATNSNILKKFINSINQPNIPIIMTVCQNPTYGKYLLSPFEIKASWKIIFIDKTSFCNKLTSFIPKSKKELIYLCEYSKSLINFYDEFLKKKNKYKSNECLVFGRGTTISKCPKDMFTVFDSINVPNKEFHIVGIPEGNNWVRKEANKRDNVKVYGILPREEWIKKCAEFDICLYHIPEECHASLDANLGLAMLLKIPVVYKGCEAPKERFEHGVNGYVAYNNDELAKYATQLAESKELRANIGKEARNSQLRKFKTPAHELYYKLYINLKKNINVKIPFNYYLKYYCRCWKVELQMLLNLYRRK